MKNLIVLTFLFLSCTAYSQSLGGQSGSEKSNDKMLLTIFLKHDQSMNVDEIEKIKTAQGFYEKFPPEGTSVVNWFVVMGIGQMIVLELPASKLREVNLAIEKTAWKAFKTEFYPTYNLYPVIENKLKNKAKITY